MWKVTLQAFAVLLLAWFFGNFVLGWFQQNSAKPKTQHSEHPSRTPDSQDQSCFCQVSHLHTVLSVTVRSGRCRSGFYGLTERAARHDNSYHSGNLLAFSTVILIWRHRVCVCVCVCVCLCVCVLLACSNSLCLCVKVITTLKTTITIKTNIPAVTTSVARHRYPERSRHKMSANS